jgi:O-antigen/teichoic acid export membrane protein
MGRPSVTETGEAVEATPEAGLNRRIFTAARWSFLATLVMKFSGIAVSIVLARLLGPNEFGVVAVALVTQAAMLSLNELGVSVALVRWQGDDRRVAPTVMTLSVAGSLVCFLSLVLAAPHIAAAFDAPGAVWPIRVMALGVLIDGCVATPAAILQRHFSQGRRAAADMTNFGLGSAVSILLAVGGAGAMALAVGRVAGSASSAVLLYRLAPYRPRFGWSRPLARELLGVGIPLAAASLVVFGILNLDYVVVGRTIGPVGLGLYLLAFNLSSWPVSLLSGPVRSVALPAFARMAAHPAQLSKGVLEGFGGLMAVTLPVAATLGALAAPLVHFVYGDEWARAAAVLAWLAALGACRVAAEFLYDVLVAVGESRKVLLIQLVWLGSLAVALPLGAHWKGIVGVGVAHSAVALLVVLPMYLSFVTRRVHITLPAVLARLAVPVLVSAGIVAVALVCQRSLPDLATLLVAGGVGGLATLHAGWRLKSRLQR